MIRKKITGADLKKARLKNKTKTKMKKEKEGIMAPKTGLYANIHKKKS